MDDLISRKTALELLGEPHPLDHNAIADVQKIIALPSVPAVPLDKLCEWLGTHYAPCQLMDDCDSPCMLEGVGQMSGAECWHYLIRTKVLEKLDGGDADDNE